jgi:error-prone DNA polymerase
MDVKEQTPSLASMQLHEHVTEDYRKTGLSLKSHPLAFARERLNALGVLPCNRLTDTADRAIVKVAGIVLVRQRPETARGVTFITLEDETHQANVIVWPSTFERFHKIARGSAGLIVEGRLQKQGELIHLVANRLLDLADIMQVQRQSRDFR